MCLYADKALLKQWKARQKAKGKTWVKVWKVVRPNATGRFLEAEWQRSYHYHPGVNRVWNPRDGRTVRYKEEIRSGVIHCYVNLRAAKGESNAWLRVLPVWVNVRDVVTMGYTARRPCWGVLTIGARKVTVEEKAFHKLFEGLGT